MPEITSYQNPTGQNETQYPTERICLTWGGLSAMSKSKANVQQVPQDVLQRNYWAMSGDELPAPLGHSTLRQALAE